MPDTRTEQDSAAKGPKLVTIPEIPALLVAAGIKPVGLTRLRQLAARPEFPAPAYERGRTRLWDWTAVEAYFRGRVLRQGERTDLKGKQEGPDEPAGTGS